MIVNSQDPDEYFLISTTKCGIWQRHLEHRRVEKEQGSKRGQRTTESQMS